MYQYQSRFEMLFKALFILLLIYLTYILISSPNHWILLDGANLIIHEVGHPLFMAFGTFAGFLGGTIFQLFIPSAIFVYFILKQQLFSAGFGLFWIGENLVNISVYMKDATEMALPLVGWGAIHDWNWMFSELGILKYDQLIGNVTFVMGLFVIGISICVMIALTYLQAMERARLPPI
jgi:hypothetical protein